MQLASCKLHVTTFVPLVFVIYCLCKYILGKGNVPQLVILLGIMSCKIHTLPRSGWSWWPFYHFLMYDHGSCFPFYFAVMQRCHPNVNYLIMVDEVWVDHLANSLPSDRKCGKRRRPQCNRERPLRASFKECEHDLGDFGPSADGSSSSPAEYPIFVDCSAILRSWWGFFVLGYLYFQLREQVRSLLGVC